MAQLVNAVDLKNGLLSGRACALSHSVVEPYFPSKQNTNFSVLHCTVLVKRIMSLSLSMTQLQSLIFLYYKVGEASSSM